MNRVRLAGLALAAVAALVAACDDTVSDAPVRLSQPSAVAVFVGITPKNAGLHPYVAIANAGRDDLTLVDAVDDKAVLSPIVTRSLTVPVPDPRPTLLVGSTLWDGLDASPPAAEATADLLVVASAGSPVLQLVKTWDPEGDVTVVPGQAVDLSAVAPGAEILALETAPVPDGASPPAPVPGRVRVFAALTGARLAVVDYARTADGGIAPGAPAVRALEAGGVPFDAVDLAVSPFDHAHLYAASPDPIGGVFGVAELDVRGDPAAWTVRALDARGPTRLVAAWRLKERKPADTGEPAVNPSSSAFEENDVDRVYAALDPTGCGADQRVPCGIAVLDPVAGRIRPDLPGVQFGTSQSSTAMSYLAPIQVPGVPTALAISGPPARAPDTDDDYLEPPWMRISPGTGARGTSAVMVVPSTTGRVYMVDLARWAVPNERSILQTDSRTRATDVAAIGLADSERRLGLWTEREEPADGETPAARFVAVETADLIDIPDVTPGYTTGEEWEVRFQGEMPGFTSADRNVGMTGRLADGRTWLALQAADPLPGGGTVLRRVVRLYDPAFGLRAGDLALVSAPGVAGCPETVDGETKTVEARIGELLAPTVDWPGGAIALDPSLQDPTVDDPATEDVVETPEDWPACIAALADGHTVVAVFRAAEMVLVGSLTGYAGRPEIVYAEDLETSAPFQVAHEDEDTLSCPLVPWPDDPGAITCDSACREQCERLVLARKTRRRYHLSDKCETVACSTLWQGHTFPVSNGPLLSFRLGYRPELADDDRTVVDPEGRLPADNEALWGTLRQMSLEIDTQAGLTPSSRSPVASNSVAPIILPLGADTFDRSPYEGKEADAYRFYVPYVYDFVLDFSPAQALNLPVVIR